MTEINKIERKMIKKYIDDGLNYDDVEKKLKECGWNTEKIEAGTSYYNKMNNISRIGFFQKMQLKIALNRMKSAIDKLRRGSVEREKIYDKLDNKEKSKIELMKLEMISKILELRPEVFESIWDDKNDKEATEESLKTWKLSELVSLMDEMVNHLEKIAGGDYNIN